MKYETFSNKENFFWLVLGCINEFCNFANIAQRGTTSCIQWYRKPQRLATKTSKTAAFENFEITAREPKSLPLTPYPYSLKQEGMKNEE